MAGETHQKLISLAAGWLTKSRRCCLVATDLVTACGETPDAIGWYGVDSILVECKASRSDFRRDKDKPCRRRSDIVPALGVERYYLAPAGIIPQEELLPGWGLLELNDRGKVSRIVESGRFQVGHQMEVAFLLSLIRRMGPEHPKGAFCKFYTIENMGLATVGIEPEAGNEGVT